MKAEQILEIEKTIIYTLRNIYDPEIPVNIYDLGLIYDVEYEPSGNATITMTLTAPNCPMADELVQQVHDLVLQLDAVKKVDVVLTFEPAWDRSRMSDEALLELGML